MYAIRSYYAEHGVDVPVVDHDRARPQALEREPADVDVVTAGGPGMASRKATAWPPIPTCSPGSAPRITSYNVCYTKLLRKVKHWCEKVINSTNIAQITTQDHILTECKIIVSA